MKKLLLSLLYTFFIAKSFAQVKNYYEISLNNALHHEATVKASFGSIQPGKIIIEIANRAPSRFGSYNFIKNIYDLKITNNSGKELKYNKVGYDKWEVEEHDGSISISYTVFADKGNETFSQINEEFAILNHPSIFAYIPALSSRPIEVAYKNLQTSNSSIVNQLKASKNKTNTYEASNLEEFMDAPTLIGEITATEKVIESGSKDYTLGLYAISDKSENELTQLLDEINNVTEEQKNIFGGYPKFENNTYSLLLGLNGIFGKVNEAHRNSSLLTLNTNNETVNKEMIVKNFAKSFFKSWNGTRICPVSLKPFDYKNLPIVKEYWFINGFAEYYALLTLCRANVISQERFLQEIAYHLSDIKKSAALQYFNALEMSENAGINYGLSKYSNPQNTTNTIIPIDKHGAVIALMLDLSLRDKELSLDGFMKLLWTKYGKIDQAFSIENFYSSLHEYAGDSFTENFFDSYIYGSAEFETNKLLENFGISTTPVEVPYLGVTISFDNNDSAVISEYTSKNTAAYEAGLEKGDIITSVNNEAFSDITELNAIVSKFKIGKKVAVKYNRAGIEKATELKLETNPNIILSSMLKSSSKASEMRRLWLGEE